MYKKEIQKIFEENKNKIPKDILEFYEYKITNPSFIRDYYKDYNYDVIKYRKYYEELTIEFNSLYCFNSNYDIDFWCLEVDWSSIWDFNYRNKKDNIHLQFFIKIWDFYKYYYVERRWDRELTSDEILIMEKFHEFMNKKWYKQLPKEIWDIPTDIVWNEFMPYDDHIEKQRDKYKEWTKDWHYEIEEMDYWFIPKDREKDFEYWCKDLYEWPYTIFHVVFGEPW